MHPPVGVVMHEYHGARYPDRVNTPPWAAAIRARWRHWHLGLLLVVILVVVLVAADSAIAQQAQYAAGSGIGVHAQADPVSTAVGDPTNWLDITSRVGVVAIALLGGWLWLTGRIYTRSAVDEIRAGHARELAERDRLLAHAEHECEQTAADRDAWKVAAGNSLEGLTALDRATASTLEEKSLVVALVETIQQIAQGSGGGGGGTT